jgi:photosystem II stability/assembly factor-like uncharacterized protein
MAGKPGLAAAAGARGSRHLAAVDFVTPAIGWVVVERETHDFVVLHTADAGQTWNRQLAGLDEVIGEYLRFFDPAHGVLVLLGSQAALYQTSDGGNTWDRQPLTRVGGYVLSVDFVDAKHGWVLAQASTEGEALLRTEDGGVTWEGLGSPVAYSDWAYRVVFADSSNGWLYSQSNSPYAYKSEDGGTSWRRIGLPAPPGGWPPQAGGADSTGHFFVAPHPTRGAGVTATVLVDPSSSRGQSSGGRLPLDFPVLRVRTFDGGGSMTSVYADVSRYSLIGSSSLPRDRDVPNQFQLSSVDGGGSWKAISTPSVDGAVGYFDALNWWWIGSGVQSKSSDAGTTWVPISSMPAPAPLPESLQIVDATHVWFGAMAGARPLVEATDDGGAHWRMVLLPATP